MFTELPLAHTGRLTREFIQSYDGLIASYTFFLVFLLYLNVPYSNSFCFIWGVACF